MPDQAAASPLTLAVDRSGNAAAVRCSGRLVAGVNDRLYLEVSQLIPSSKRILLDLTDLTHMDSSGLGTLVRLYVRKIGRLRFATLQHWETDSATSWRHSSFVGIRGDWQQQHQVRMILRSCGASSKNDRRYRALGSMVGQAKLSFHS